MSEPITVRNYTCHSPMCDGQVKGQDRVPKMYGRAAECWACGSDLYTLPRYGASDEVVLSRPGVTAKMIGTNVPPSVFTGPMGWMQAFQGLVINRPEGATE